MQLKRLGNLAAAALFSASLLVPGAVAHAQEEEAEEEESWTDMLTFSAFVDANVSVTSQKSGINPVGYPNDPGSQNHRAYVSNNGFALNFAGLDASINGEQFGATISLRFGPSVISYFGNNSAWGFANLTQAYVTWMPHEKITLDFGEFGTIYGAEVAESWMNQNYTRGAMYWGMQPFWHTGLRAGFQITDTFGLKALLVNGINDIMEFDKGPSVGLQAALELDQFSLYLGYFGATDPTSAYKHATGVPPKGGSNPPLPSALNNLFSHIIDITGSASAGNFNVVFNGDIGIVANKVVPKNQLYYAMSAAPGYAFTDWFGVAARAEYLHYRDKSYGAPYKDLVTLTGTLDFKPIPHKSNVILRPEFRYEIADKAIYFNRDNDPGLTKHWWLLTLGAVVTTDG